MKAWVIPFYTASAPTVLIKSRGRSNDLKTFRTVIFATYDGLDIGLICSWMYASGS